MYNSPPTSRIPPWLRPGLLAAAFLVAIGLAALLALLLQGGNAPAQRLADPYLWHVLRFTFWQATLATALAVIPAIFLARALQRRHFPGRDLLLRFATMTLALPTLVAISGILGVYGKQGWLAHLWQAFGGQWTFKPYGLTGILLVHQFFALPLATRLLLNTLEQIPGEQRQLAAQLGVRGWPLFRHLEWPWLRRQLPPVAALIYMLCFTSFSTILILGGGPKATTIELAIYQALTFTYQPDRAALLALVQITCCLSLVLIAQMLAKNLNTVPGRLHPWHDTPRGWWPRLADSILIALFLLYQLPPLIAVLLGGLNPHLGEVLRDPALWRAIYTSLRIALPAGLLSITLCLMLLWSSRELRLRGQRLPANLLETAGMLNLAMPGIVLATGLFLLLRRTTGLPQHADFLIILCNSLMAIPYTLKILAAPMQDIASNYHRLCANLGVRGLPRLKHIELRALKRPLAQAYAFACVLSLGDLGIIALFGNADFATLPYHLYQQLGAYRNDASDVTALILLLLSLALYTLIEHLAHAPARKP